MTSLAACFTVVTEWAGPAAGTVTEVVAHWSAAIGTTAGLYLIKIYNGLTQRELIIALIIFCFPNYNDGKKASRHINTFRLVSLFTIATH